MDLFQNMTVERDLPKMIKNSTQLSEHLSKSIHVFIIGSNDYINYYLGTKHNGTIKTDQSITFAKLLIARISEQLEVHYFIY